MGAVVTAADQARELRRIAALIDDGLMPRVRDATVLRQIAAAIALETDISAAEAAVIIARWPV
jgi:hypothetical protein